MSVEWGNRGDKKSSPAQPTAPPSPWEEIAGSFPAWTLEPPFTLAPRINKPTS
jgi:hypothetical protein